MGTCILFAIPRSYSGGRAKDKEEQSVLTTLRRIDYLGIITLVSCRPIHRRNFNMLSTSLDIVTGTSAHQPIGGENPAHPDSDGYIWVDSLRND